MWWLQLLQREIDLAFQVGLHSNSRNSSQQVFGQLPGTVIVVLP